MDQNKFFTKFLDELKERNKLVENLDVDETNIEKIFVNFILASKYSMILKVYTDELLGRKLSWKEFKKYLEDNVKDKEFLTLIVTGIE
jgi:hypothetical protein